MDACNFCSSPLTTSYYRVLTVKVCAVCINKERIRDVATRKQHFFRGLMFAVPVAVAGSLLKWGLDEVSLLAGGSLFSPGAYLRGAMTFFLGYMIAEAAMAGSKKRGSIELQVAVVVLTYAAYCSSVIPYALSRVPSGHITSRLVVLLVSIAPFTPFLALLKNWLAITGLAAVCISMLTACRITAPRVQITGPFDSNDRFAERPVFTGSEVQI